MNRPASFFSVFPGGRRSKGAAATRGVADFLRTHDKMAALLPAVARLAELQKDCSAILPALFDVCSALQFDAGQLTVATPNAAVASKLKQQLPKLQDGLLKRGWQVNSIRLKVQVGKIAEKARPAKQISLPPRALSAIAELKESLEDSPRNDALKAALESMLRHHLRQR
jgi:hypothetical protein